MFTASEQLTWLEQILTPLSKLRVAVFGDFCLDVYWGLETGETTELSVETGLPVRRVRNQRYSLGGAGNVAANLVALRIGQVQAIGVVGADLFGREMMRLLSEWGIDTRNGMVVEEDWQTMVYAKPCSGDQEENRIDFGAFNVLTERMIDALIAALDNAASQSNVVILNQQIPKGLNSPPLIDRVNEMIVKHKSTRFVVDARHSPDLYKGAVLKVNAREAARFLGDDPAEEFFSAQKCREFARRIARKTGKAVFLTRGKNGIIVADGETVSEVPGIQIVAAIDSVGAGDTVVSAIAAVLGSGQPPMVAAKVANIAATVTVQKLRMTGTAAPAEILAAGGEPDYIYEPELADTPYFAQYLEGTEIERVGNLPQDLQIKHCIFDHDGTLSTLREGWEKIMEPMMVKAVLGPRYSASDPALFTKVTGEVRRFIDRTTGIQTLVQMKGLVELVRQAGFVPGSEILNEHEYKRIFNQDLLEMVNRRMKKLGSGELSSSDFQIKNAELLLRELHRKSIKLYLASGTDEADVIAEAEAMGYADIFEGRIFGAVGDVKVEAKKVVLERIIRENSLAGHQFATFGDGPVEMRETRKRGGFCIGVASDEVRRFGWNQAKRSRLIRAGSTLLVPDFSQLPALLRAMQLA